MSARFTLYGQSLLRNANGVNFLDQDRHWGRDWVYPPRSIAPSDVINGSPSNIGTPLESSSNTPQPSIYNFQIKTWVIKPNVDLVEDGTDVDFLHLPEFEYFKEGNNNHEERQSEDTPGGLTEADIRGAVGGVDQIGFGSSAAKPE